MYLYRYNSIYIVCMTQINIQIFLKIKRIQIQFFKSVVEIRILLLAFDKFWQIFWYNTYICFQRIRRLRLQCKLFVIFCVYIQNFKNNIKKSKNQQEIFVCTFESHEEICNTFQLQLGFLNYLNQFWTQQFNQYQDFIKSVNFIFQDLVIKMCLILLTKLDLILFEYFLKKGKKKLNVYCFFFYVYFCIFQYSNNQIYQDNSLLHFFIQFLGFI
eukprot:TRINITY_DN2990_c0_g3_i1.p1 TRINITY_DN2990_c0_g3~~TRINITY_DN2990_c0_g3_i1.p1  ORF type:complete len:214 (+),score=-14.69 TRINITY_DN2990_c0_g3_i1:439-1080(+)